MPIFPARSVLMLSCVLLGCTTHSPLHTSVPEMAAPATLSYCKITLSCNKDGENSPTTFIMGENAPMPKLKIFEYKAVGQSAQISFDGVGDGCAVHFNGKLELISQDKNCYTFKPTGEIIGFEGDSENKFQATPISLKINIVPEPQL